MNFVGIPPLNLELSWENRDECDPYMNCIPWVHLELLDVFVQRLKERTSQLLNSQQCLHTQSVLLVCMIHLEEMVFYAKLAELVIQMIKTEIKTKILISKIFNLLE